MRPYAVFVTLNYSDDFLPVFHCSQKAELYKPDLNSFIDRIKKARPECTVFAVGEYGGTLFGSDKATREIHPHYHLCIFSDDSKFYEVIKSVVDENWEYGFTHVLMLSAHLMNYISGYTIKKLNKPKDMNKVMMLPPTFQPEFARWPRNPSIGDISEIYCQAIEQFGYNEKIIIDGKLTRMPKSLLLRIDKKLLTHDLDLKKVYGDVAIYERRKYYAKIEKMQLRLEAQAQKIEAIMLSENISLSDAYCRQNAYYKQSTKNFEIQLNLKNSTKKEKKL